MKVEVIIKHLTLPIQRNVHSQCLFFVQIVIQHIQNHGAKRQTDRKIERK
jgi:hypothetical protein